MLYSLVLFPLLPQGRLAGSIIQLHAGILCTSFTTTIKSSCIESPHTHTNTLGNLLARKPNLKRKYTKKGSDLLSLFFLVSNVFVYWNVFSLSAVSYFLSHNIERIDISSPPHMQMNRFVSSQNLLFNSVDSSNALCILVHNNLIMICN